MKFCPPNVTFSEIWINHGLSSCFLETVSTSVIFAFILITGCIEFSIYKKYSTLLDQRVLRKSCLFSFHMSLMFILPILVIVKFVLQAFILDEKQIHGYMILVLSMELIMWPFSLYLVLTERRKALPSIPTNGHGLVLLIFWALVLIRESLVFININKITSWFYFMNFSDYIHCVLFVLYYTSIIFLFLIGLKAPGIPRAQDLCLSSWSLNNSESEELLRSSIITADTGSTFSNIFNKLKRLVPFIWPRNNVLLQIRVLICFLFLILGRVTNLYIPIYNKDIVNSLAQDYPAQKIPFKWHFILIYVILWFLQGQGGNSFLNNMRSLLWIRVQQFTVKATQVELYTHLHNLSLRWHLSKKTGEVLRVMDRGTNSITSLLSYILFNIVPTLFDIVIAVIYLSYALNVWFGVIVFITMIIYLMLTIAITEWRTKFRRSTNLLDNATQAKGVDALMNFETVKYYVAEEYEVNNYSQSVDAYQKMEWKASASLNLLNTLQNITISIGVLFGSLLCTYLITSGSKLNVGDYVLFSSYILQLYTPLSHFGTYYRMIQTAFIDMENLFQLFDVEPEVQDKVNAKSLTLKGGKIEFKNVTFSYLPERIILKNISFKVPPGSTLAIVGPSGSGKSTIVRLLFRFYSLNEGQILIDGQDISDVKQKSLRSYIGVVPQDTVLFNQDIRYNIRYGRVNATDGEVVEAAKAADIHNSIATFPLGYDTIVGERGLKLSGGEKQRVAISRTILKAPQIILLDEATSSLDSQTERNIQSAFSMICAKKTSIVIAHRLSTIVNADEIIVLKDTEIVERGTHEELLKQGTVYSDMWSQQLKAAEQDLEDNLIES